MAGSLSSLALWLGRTSPVLTLAPLSAHGCSAEVADILSANAGRITDLVRMAACGKPYGEDVRSCGCLERIRPLRPLLQHSSPFRLDPRRV